MDLEDKIFTGRRSTNQFQTEIRNNERDKISNYEASLVSVKRQESTIQTQHTNYFIKTTFTCN